ncbi:MAG: hypothetical protein A4S17_02265 [Proteobacteria bacterium HN_bin10]|nr:MAG: hypothetical protein A4S17_02265 [Proteobacteria bacterium HN_bin10]
MPGLIVLMFVLVVVLAITSLIPSVIAAFRGRWGLAFALAVTGASISIGPWLLMFVPGLGRLVGDVSMLLLIVPVVFAVGASFYVFLLPTRAVTRVDQEGEVAPWVREMREELKRHQ